MGQQLITLPHPSDARPHVCPSCWQVLAVHVAGGVPQRLGVTAPQNWLPVHVRPPLPAPHVWLPPQPFGTVPHLPLHAVPTGISWQLGAAPHSDGDCAPQDCPLGQERPHWMSPPQPSGALPQLTEPPPPGHACANVRWVHGGLPHALGTLPPPQLSPTDASQVRPPFESLQSYTPPQPLDTGPHRLAQVTTMSSGTQAVSVVPHAPGMPPPPQVVPAIHANGVASQSTCPPQPLPAIPQVPAHAVASSKGVHVTMTGAVHWLVLAPVPHTCGALQPPRSAVQSSTPPQPSPTWPHCAPASAHVLGWQGGRLTQWLGSRAPG